jgi:hypothetical protein
MYPVTCQEYIKYEAVYATRPLSQLMRDVNIKNAEVSVMGDVFVNCGKNPTQCNMRLVLPFTEQIITYDSCPLNELASLANRHLNVNDILTTPIQYALWKRTFLHYCIERPPVMIKPYTVKQVLQSKKPSKRKTYTQALNSLHRRPLDFADCVIKMFVKNERMTIKDPLKPPRAIQARSPRYNLIFQKYTLAFSEHHKKQQLFKRNFTSGMDQYEIAQWLLHHWNEYAHPVADMLDHAFFDSKQHEIILFFQNLYVFLCFGETEYWQLYAARLNNRCVSRNNIHYKVHATRLSGDGDTSSGNTTVNDMMLSYVYRKVQHSRALNGDDSVIIREYADTNYVDRKTLEQYGFATKFNTTDEFEAIEYCQCHPVYTINGWLMVRDPMRVMSRATVCINRSIRDVNTFKRWCRGVGECEYTCNAGVPILQSFAKFMMRATHDNPIYDDDFVNRRIEGTRDHTITDRCRASFEKAFHISVSRQHELESYFDNLSWPNQCFNKDWPTDSNTAL